MLLNVLSAVISIQQFDNQLSGILNILCFSYFQKISICGQFLTFMSNAW